MVQLLLSVCTLLLGVLQAVAQQQADVDSTEKWLAAMGTPSVDVIRVTADIAFSPSQSVPNAGPAGVYVLTRNVTIMGPDKATDWFPTLDYSLVFTAKVRVPRNMCVVMRHITLGHLGPQGSLSSGAVGYDLPFFDNSSSGLIAYSECYLVLLACAPLELTGQVLATLPRPASMPGNQQFLLLPKGACVPPNPARVLSGKCFSAAFMLTNAAWQKDVIGTALYSPVEGDAISAYHNVTVLCDQVFSLECLQTEGLLNCTKHLAEGRIPTGVPPLGSGGQQPAPSSDDNSGVIIGVSVGAAVGGLLLVMLAASAVYAFMRRPSPPCFVTEPKILVTIGAPDDATDNASPPDSWEVRCKDDAEVGDKGEETSSSSIGASPSLRQTAAVVAADDSEHADTLSPLSSRPPSASLPGVSLTASTPDVVTQLNKISHDLETTISDNQLMIKEVIGTGAYGTVYRGTWKGLPVAVKSLLFTSDAPGPNGGVTKKDRILMEAALSKSISHPNVVTSYSCDLKPIAVDRDMVAGSSGLMVSADAHVLNHWRLYIIQELCDGGSLRRAVELHSLATKVGSIPEIPLGTVLELACGLACGMSHLHDRNVIHGDLNPANVLLKWLSPGRLIPKVCDFGLSVHLTGDKSHVSNSNRGTPFYIAPEVASHGSLSRAADVYAMGVILWELYMGKIVWTVSHTGRIVQRSTFPFMPRGTPPKYQSLVAACLDADPARRPTFAAVLKRLVEMHRDLTMGPYPSNDAHPATAAADAPAATAAAATAATLTPAPTPVTAPSNPAEATNALSTTPQAVMCVPFDPDGGHVEVEEPGCAPGDQSEDEWAAAHLSDDVKDGLAPPQNVVATSEGQPLDAQLTAVRALSHGGGGGGEFQLNSHNEVPVMRAPRVTDHLEAVSAG